MNIRNNYHSGLKLLMLIILILVSTLRVQPTHVKAYHGTYALFFDGINDEVGLGYTDSMLGPNWKTRKAVTLWYKPTGSAPVVNNFIQDGDIIVGGRPDWWGIYRANQNGTDRLWFWNWDTNPDVISTPYTVNEWVHLALVQENGTLSAYKNGQFLGSRATNATGGTDSEQLMIGGMTMGPDRIMRAQGYIDEVAYWDIPPTQDMIRSWMYREIDNSHPNWSSLGGYYRMSDGSGLTLTDDGPNSYNGTLVGTPDWVASSAFSGPKSALDFDGINDSAVVSDSDLLDITGNITFEGWINPTNWNNNTFTPFLVKGDGTTPDVNYYFGKNTLNQLVFRYGTTTLIDIADTSGASFSNGIWYHVAIVVDVTNSQVRFYRNGQFLSSTPYSIGSLPANLFSLSLSAFPNSSDTLFSGQADEWRLWSSARTENEIRQDMFDTLRGNESGLAAYYRFDQPAVSSETTLEDVSPNNLDGTLINMTPTSDWVASTAFNTWVGVTSTEWNTAENWSRGIVPGTSDNVGVSADYASANLPSINSAVSTSNVVLESGAQLQVTNTGDLTVSGYLYNMGTLQQVKPVSGSSDHSFFGTGSYGGLIINSNGDDLGNTTVTIRGNLVCTSLSNPVLRCFDITSDNSPSSGANVSFFYNDSELNGNNCSTMNVYHWNGSIWELKSLNSRECVLTPRSVSIQNVTSFSPFVLKSSTPTAISLKTFIGTSGGDRTSLIVAAIAITVIGIVALLTTKRKFISK